MLARSSFKGKMFKVFVFHRLKGCFCELIKNNGKLGYFLGLSL